MKFTFIDNIKHSWKLWSVWFFIIIGIAPDLYNGISAMGWLDEAPKAFVWTIRALSVMGLASRLIKKKRLEKDDDYNTKELS